MNPDQQPTNATSPNDQQPVTPVTPKDNRKRTIIISVVAAIVVLSAIVGAVLFFATKDNNQQTTIDESPVASLAQKDTLTDAEVANLDKTNAFWAYFKNAAQQSALTITKEYHYANSLADPTELITAKQTGFDYNTKKIVQYVQMPGLFDDDSIRYRCYDDKEFVLSQTSDGWRQVDADDREYCNLESEAIELNDGVNTGGLNAQQADAMVQTLIRQSGLMTVDKLELAKKQNKQYLRFDVTLNPILAQKENLYMGNQWLMWAFKETGLNPATHPYAYAGAGGNGFKMTYYVDPTTKLPAYSELITTPIKDAQGNDKSDSAKTLYKTLYTFGSMPDVTSEEVKDITVKL